MRAALSAGLILAIAWTALAAPNPTQPANDARLTWGSPVPTIRWEAEVGATRYDLELALDEAFLVSSGPFPMGDRSYPLPLTQEAWDPLSLDVYWRVRSVVTGVPGEWSRIMRFSKTRLWVPDLFSPIEDERIGPNEAPFFAWEPNVIGWEWEDLDEDGEPDHDPTILYPKGYEVQFALDQNFHQPLDPPVRVGYNENSREYSLAGLIDWHEWNPAVFSVYWRLYGVDGVGRRGPPTEVRRLSKGTLLRPEWTLPDDETILEHWADMPVFEWAPVEGAAAYDIGFVDSKHKEHHLGTIPWITDTRLELWDYIEDWHWQNFWGSLYWRISPIGLDGQLGPWSVPQAITKKAYRRVICLGDSITGGWGSVYWDEFEDGPWGFDRAGYPRFLNNRLESQLWPAQAASWWIAGGQAWEGNDQVWESMEAFGAEYVIFMFGSVDIIDPAGCPGECLPIHNMEGIIDQVLAFGATPVLSTVIPPNPADHWWIIDSEVQALNVKIRNLAEQRGLPLADQYEALTLAGGENIEDLFVDALHLTDAGYQVMADEAYRVLSELIREAD